MAYYGSQQYDVNWEPKGGGKGKGKGKGPGKGGGGGDTGVGALAAVMSEKMHYEMWKDWDKEEKERKDKETREVDEKEKKRRDELEEAISKKQEQRLKDLKSELDKDGEKRHQEAINAIKANKSQSPAAGARPKHHHQPNQGSGRKVRRVASPAPPPEPDEITDPEEEEEVMESTDGDEDEDEEEDTPPPPPVKQKARVATPKGTVTPSKKTSKGAARTPPKAAPPIKQKGLKRSPGAAVATIMKKKGSTPTQGGINKAQSIVIEAEFGISRDDRLSLKGLTPEKAATKIIGKMAHTIQQLSKIHKELAGDSLPKGTSRLDGLAAIFELIVQQN
jgi:hypothetical protein